MTSRAFLPALALLLACGSGTIRPADEPEAIAPAPAPAQPPPVVETEPPPVTPPPTEKPVAAPDTVSKPAGSEPEIRRIGRWISSNIRGARRLVIRDAATWSQFWSELGAGVRPEVSFSRDLVIAVASGERASGGHDIAVQRVARTGGELRIEVLETSPGPNCLNTASLTQPVDVVVVAGAGVTGWSFIDRTAVHDC